MTERALRERGVSTVVAYILAVAITTILLAGLVFSTTQFLRFQQSSTAQGELDVVGQQIASAVDSMDRLPPSTSNAERVIDVPSRVAGDQYQLSVEDVSSPSSKHELVLRTTDGQVSTRVPVSVSENSDLHVKDTSSGDRIVVSDQLVVTIQSNQLVIKNE